VTEISEKKICKILIRLFFTDLIICVIFGALFINHHYLNAFQKLMDVLDHQTEGSPNKWIMSFLPKENYTGRSPSIL
jgi:hypothetical protein